MVERQVKAIVIGAGNRGFAYSRYALNCKDKFKIVGVADPNKCRREKMRLLHNIPPEAVFETWQEVVVKPKFADAVLVTTLDQMHKEPAVACAKLGYHILLEKPMATTPEDCKEIADICKKEKVMLAVGHVLRYDAHAIMIRDIIRSGELGQVINIQHLEPIGYWHFCHSFVRGNWRNKDSTTFLFMAKCCHDVDLIQMWLGPEDKCKYISSFGSLVHFKKENKPVGAGDRCLECSVENQCAFSAKKLYCGLVQKGCKNWPLNALTDDVPDLENITESLKTGPYGKCVYNGDNDVVDNQVVIMKFESGATVNLTTVAFTKEVCERNTRICGTKGELICHFSEANLSVFDFLSETKKRPDDMETSSISRSNRWNAEPRLTTRSIDPAVPAALP